MKRFFIISNPATGQLNPLLSVSEELALRGNQVVLLSANSVLKKVQSLQTRLGRVAQADHQPSADYLLKEPVVFLALGDSPALADYTKDASDDPEVFHRLGRSVPGDIWGWLRVFTDKVPANSDEYRDTVFRVRDLIECYDPDMTIVDNFSPFAVDGVRLTGRPFIETSPGAASAVANNISFWGAPMPMSGGRTSAGGLITFLRNIWFALLWLKFIMFNPWASRRRHFRENVLGLKPVDMICDSIMTPTPGMLPEQIATISFNVAGMDFYNYDTYDKSVFFVGPCFPPKHPAAGPPPSPKAMKLGSQPVLTDTVHAPLTPLDTSPTFSYASTPTVVDLSFDKDMSSVDTIKAWLDQAQKDGKRVVYINMGSIFFYNRKDYDNLVQALLRLHDMFPDVLVLWKIPKLAYEAQPIPTADEGKLPLYIRREDWLPSVQTVLEHPAVAVCMHHGGGNSFNEALYYGIPQFCVSQWVDTHDIGAYIQHSGIGLWADKSPRFDVTDVSSKLALLLEDPGNKFQHAALTWKLRTAQAGGTKTAADIVESFVQSFRFPRGSSKLRMEMEHRKQ